MDFNRFLSFSIIFLDPHTHQWKSLLRQPHNYQEQLFNFNRILNGKYKVFYFHYKQNVLSKQNSKRLDQKNFIMTIGVNVCRYRDHHSLKQCVLLFIFLITIAPVFCFDYFYFVIRHNYYMFMTVNVKFVPKHFDIVLISLKCCRSLCKNFLLFEKSY